MKIIMFAMIMSIVLVVLLCGCCSGTNAVLNPDGTQTVIVTKGFVLYPDKKTYVVPNGQTFYIEGDMKGDYTRIKMGDKK